MQKEEQETFKLLIEAINKFEEFKNIIVKTKQYQLASTLIDIEKEVHQSMSDFFNTKRRYTEDDLRKTFTAARSEIPTDEAIFTTDDGVDLSDGKMWLLSTLGWKISEVGVCSDPFRGVTWGELKYFSTKEAAEEYRLMNKPNLSINDVLKVLRNIFEKTGELKPSLESISMKLKDMSKFKSR